MDDITNSDDLREKIHEIHNFMRNNGIGYGLTSLKTFNLFYGLMKIEDYNLNEKIGLNDEKCKFSYLKNIVNDAKNQGQIITILDEKTIDMIYKTDKVNSLIAYNVPLDLKVDVYKHLINEISLIKEIEKTSKEQLSGKIYEYVVGRDQSAISELGAYFTNRKIVEFAINKIKPQLKSDGTIPKMIDMFGGSGGFTIGYMNYLNNNYKNKIDWKTNLNNIYHFDINEDVLKSARLEFFCLSGGFFPDDNNVRRTNSFKQEFKDYGKFDLILTNPPYGGDKISTSAKKDKRDKIITFIQNEINNFKKNPKISLEKFLKENIDNIDKNDIKRIMDLNKQLKNLKQENIIELKNNKKLNVNIDSCSKDIQEFASKYKLTGNDKEACSLMLIMDLLEVNGTAVGVLKEGLFFDSTYKELRKLLIQEFNVKEVISIPSNQFENTATKTSIIIFTREEQKTSYINFSELKVNLYEKDEFVEVINNETNEIEIKLKFNKGDIINVEEIFLKSVSSNEILKNDNYSLNSKDYNKVSIECGEDFKLVKIKDICEFQPKSKRQASYGTNEGKYNFYTSSDKIKKCNEADYKDEYLIIGTGGVPNIKIDKNFSCSADNLIISNKNINYLYFLLSSNIYLLEDGFNGSTIKHLSKKYLEDLEIPIPKTPELIEYWENKISTPFMKKQEKEKKLKEVEEEIRMKIQDIQENQDCEEVKLGDICNINSGKNLVKNNIIYGKFNIIGGGKIIGKHNISNRNGNETVITRVGAINVNYIKEQYYLTDNGLALKSNMYNNRLIYYYLIVNLEILYKLYNGSNQKVIKKSELEEFKIKLPTDKKLIDNLQPLFDEVEDLQKEIKELDETYNNYLKELSISAIKNQEVLNNYDDNDEIIDNDNEINEEKNDDEIEEIKSSSSNISKQTIEQLKEQCKSLGIKGYSKKKKEELIEMIKNHK